MAERHSNRGTFRPKQKPVGPEDPTHWRYGGDSKMFVACPVCHPSGVSTCERCQTKRTVLVEDWSEFPARFYDARSGEQINHVQPLRKVDAALPEMQIALFELPLAPAEPIIWERIPGPEELGSKGIIHVHTPSRMQVLHCGHPTANFPYYILEIQGERRILALNGRGFQRLDDAKQHVEQLHREATVA